MSAVVTHPTQLGGATEKYSMEIVAAALQKSRGMVTVAAKTLGCVPKTIYNYLERYPELQEVKQDQREVVTDTAELKLLAAIERSEPWAVSLYLKTQGASRGYVERQQHEHSGVNGGPIQIENVREEKAKRITIAVQSFLDAGMGDLRDALKYFAIRGVSKDDLALIQGEQLRIPAINITPTDGHHNGSDANAETNRGILLDRTNGAGR